MATNPYEPPRSPLVDASEHDVDLASRGSRLVAALVDGVVGFAVNVPVMTGLGYWSRAMQGATSIGEDIGVAVLGFVMFFLVHGYPLHSRGQTWGKRLLGIQIVSVQDGRILPLWKVLGYRYLPPSAVSQLPGGPLLILVDILFIFRGDRRCIHDLIARTRVVRFDEGRSRATESTERAEIWK